MPLRYNAHVKTGTFDTLVAGSVTGSNPVSMGDNARQKVRALSALVTVDCETSTMTLTGKWQVSNDNSTWIDVSNGSQNAAGVVFATGTAGADADVVKCFEAPTAVYGWRYARFAFTNAVATGAATDTFSVGFSYRTGA